jgi:hypothetical protein
VLGTERAKEYIEIINSDLFESKLLVGVKEGSMVPHDPESQRGEALELWKTKGIDPITFFDRLEFPNPRESAKNLYLWQADPIRLFPDLMQEQQQQEAATAEEEAAQQQMTAEQQQVEAQEKAQREQQNKLEQIEFTNQMKQPVL